MVAVAALALVLGGCGLFGRRPPPVSTAPGSTQEGIASWYGPGFHGRRTANGEIYDQFDLTAAHQTLPHGTYVRVTNLTNGRDVLVRINDRGPFVDDRVIDLSYAAAVQLDMVGPGTAPVQLQIVPLKEVVAARSTAPVSVPATRPETATAPPPVVMPAVAHAEPARYAVQIGAFTDYARARRVQRELESRGAPARLGLVEEAGLRYYRLRLGPFTERDDATRTARRVVGLGFPALVVAGTGQ